MICRASWRWPVPRCRNALREARNVVLNTPFPGIQIKALAIRNSSQIGVFLSRPRTANLLMIQKYLKRDRTALSNELPKGTEIKTGNKWPIQIYECDIESDDEKRAWIMKTMNTFANVLRPRLRSWYADTQRIHHGTSSVASIDRSLGRPEPSTSAIA
jgi:hypothetical protein